MSVFISEAPASVLSWGSDGHIPLGGAHLLDFCPGVDIVKLEHLINLFVRRQWCWWLQVKATCSEKPAGAEMR